jgi:hypothetical protein
MPSFAEDARQILSRVKGGGLSAVQQERDRRTLASFAAV